MEICIATNAALEGLLKDKQQHIFLPLNSGMLLMCGKVFDFSHAQIFFYFKMRVSSHSAAPCT